MVEKDFEMLKKDSGQQMACQGFAGRNTQQRTEKSRPFDKTIINGNNFWSFHCFQKYQISFYYLENPKVQ